MANLITELSNKVAALATWVGDQFQLTAFKTGGTAGQVPVKNSGADFDWSWGTVSGLPIQTGNSGKFLTTNGTVASWGVVDLSTFVPNTRTVNGQALSANITISNVATATALQTPRTIAGVAFDGTANIALTAGDVGAAPSTGISPTAITGTAVVTADSRLSDARTPTTHKSSHAIGGSDVLTPADIGAQAAGDYATNTALTSGLAGKQNTITAGSLALSTLATDPLARANHTGTQAHTTITGLSTLATTTPATGVAAFLTTPSSANLAAALTDETGTGAAVFATSPTLTTPNIGAATGTSLTTTGVIRMSHASAPQLEFLHTGTSRTMLIYAGDGDINFRTGINTKAFKFQNNSGVTNTQISDAGTITTINLTASGTVTAANGVFTTGANIGAATGTSLSLTAGTSSSSSTTGTLIVTGGIGISGVSYFGGNVFTAGFISPSLVRLSGGTGEVKIYKGTGNGVFTVYNQSEASSVSFDCGTLNIVKIRNAANNADASVTALNLTASGTVTGANLILSPSASVTPANNGNLVVEATSNTSVTIKLKGSDGVVRSVVLTLA